MNHKFLLSLFLWFLFPYLRLIWLHIWVFFQFLCTSENVYFYFFSTMINSPDAEKSVPSIRESKPREIAKYPQKSHQVLGGELN